MKQKLFAFLLMFVITPCWAISDVFGDMITDSTTEDFNLDTVSLNPGASGVAVSGFDIAGVLLGMQFEDIQTLFFHNKSLYAPRDKNSVVYTMHQEWKDNLDYECRQQNIFVPDDVEKCVNSLARSRGVLYASEVHLKRENTGETLVIFFTSNATDNRVWRVMYNNDVNEIEGASDKFVRQQEKKILSWWQNVIDKYGEPNSGTDKWITSNNAYDPTMTAYYGSLDLVDMGLRTSDDALNVQQSRDNFKSKPYAF